MISLLRSGAEMDGGADEFLQALAGKVTPWPCLRRAVCQHGDAHEVGGHVRALGNGGGSALAVTSQVAFCNGTSEGSWELSISAAAEPLASAGGRVDAGKRDRQAGGKRPGKAAAARDLFRIAWFGVKKLR